MQLGVHPGDLVLLEQCHGEWVIKAVATEAAMSLKGNALANRKTPMPVADYAPGLLEDIGPIRLMPRGSFAVNARIVSVPRRPISITTED